MEIATSRYVNADAIRASGLAPVRITLGPPRMLDYGLAGDVRRLAPRPRIFRLTGAEFQDAYLAQLEQLDVDALVAKLDEIAAAAGAPGVVLLCFEDVHAGEACHRRIFAEWWERRTGSSVRELL